MIHVQENGVLRLFLYFDHKLIIAFRFSLVFISIQTGRKVQTQQIEKARQKSILKTFGKSLRILGETVCFFCYQVTSGLSKHGFNYDENEISLPPPK
jgi:hypothetical protein